MSRLFLILRLAAPGPASPARRGRHARHRHRGGHGRADPGPGPAGTTAHPYQATRQATSGPDALATDFPASTGARCRARPRSAESRPLARAPGVVAYSGPFPVAFPVLTANGHTDAVLAEGRGTAPAAVDQPELTEGSWVRRGAVVIERSFADALGLHAGDRITLNGRPFTSRREWRSPPPSRSTASGSSKAARSGPTPD